MSKSLIMKKILFSLATLLICFCVSAQIVNIPDANFKAMLLLADTNNFIARNLNGDFFKIDSNNDSEIQVSEATQVSLLILRPSEYPTLPIHSLEGVRSFINLEILDCSGSGN